MKHLVLILFGLLSAAASAQDQSSPAQAPHADRWYMDLSLTTMYDGNINHDLVPVRSYGVAPSAEFRYESSEDPALVWGYDIAVNSFTGTDQWDRISHGLYTVMTSRWGERLRFETGAEATWKGSSEDRELANEFGVSERVAYRLSRSTRLVLAGAYRYKQYPGDPDTSGLSPYVGGKIDQRLPHDRRLAFGYKYQTRRSHATRDRYARTAYTVEFSTPMATPGDRFSLEFGYRPQRYQRLIKVAGGRVIRQDRRAILGAEYRRPLSARVEARWQVGAESRDSNDPTKRFFAPTVGMTVAYHWR